MAVKKYRSKTKAFFQGALIAFLWFWLCISIGAIIAHYYPWKH